MNDLIEEFVQELRQASGKNTVEIRLHVTSEGYEVNEVAKSPEALKDSAITMRNIRGEMITY
jgi:hypothetical protein